MFKSKKGQEMSVNVLVGIILGILMLSAGLFLFFKISQNTDDATKKLDAQMEEVTMKALDSGDPVYLPDTNIDVRKKSARFWVGIKNINDEQREFKVIVASLDSNPANFAQSRIIYLSDYTIPAKEKEFFPVVVDMEGITGKVSLLVLVKVKNPQSGVYEDYQKPKMVYIEP